MKKIKMVMVMFVAFSFLISLIDVAPLVANGVINTGPTPKQVPTQKPPKSQIPKNVLKTKNLKLNPRDLVGVKYPKALSPAFYAEWKKVANNYDNLVTNIPVYEEKAKEYNAKCEECKNKIYTPEDMTSAGCQPSDSVAACSQKLFHWCTGPSQMSMETVGLALASCTSTINTSSKKALDEIIKSVNNQFQ